MKKNFLVLAVLIVVVIGIALFTACRDDVVLPPPASLEGSYIGTYTYTVDAGDDPDTLMQGIIWTFTPTDAQTGQFAMDADRWSPAFDTTVCFCKGRGLYSISDRVILQAKDDRVLPDNCETCNPDYSALGQFALNRSSGVVLQGSETNEDGFVSKSVVMRLGMPTLSGNYEGLYIYRETGSDDSTVQAVKYSFTDERFQMSTDVSAALYDPAVCLCLSSGSYALATVGTNGFMTLTLETGVPDNCATCEATLSPDGEFALEQSQKGFYRLTRTESAFTATIIMTRIGD